MLLWTVMKEEDFLSERNRAEDILLGSLGFDDGAMIVTVEVTSDGYRGTGRWADGETFDFSCDEDLDDLQRWALQILEAREAAPH